MYRRTLLNQFLIFLVLASPAWVRADEPKRTPRDEALSHEEALKLNEEMRAAGVPQIFIDTRYVEIDTSMYNLFIDGYQPTRPDDNVLPAVATHVIQVVPKNAMREMTDREDKPIPFGMRHLYSDMSGDSHFEGVVLNGVVEIKLGTTEYDFYDHSTPKTFPEDPKQSEKLIGVEYLYSPRLLVFSGQKASMMTGSFRPHLIKENDGCLRLSEGNEFTDGTKLEVGATLQDDGNILLDPLTASFSQMVGREKIEGVPFDVGKPIVQTAAMSMSLVISQKATAVFALPRFDENAPVILVLIRTYVASAEPQAEAGPKAVNAE